MLLYNWNVFGDMKYLMCLQMYEKCWNYPKYDGGKQGQWSQFLAGITWKKNNREHTYQWFTNGDAFAKVPRTKITYTYIAYY